MGQGLEPPCPGRCPFLWQGVELDDLGRPLPTQTTLGLDETLGMMTPVPQESFESPKRLFGRNQVQMHLNHFPTRLDLATPPLSLLPSPQ